jgi:putative transposase
MDGDLIYKRVKRFNVPGHVHFITFSCYQRLPLLSNGSWRDFLATCVREACDKLNFALWAYVLMPEHVHLLVRPRNETYKISEFFYEAKKPFATKIISELREKNAFVLKKLEVKNAGERAHRFWQPGGGYDSNLWSWERIIQKAVYCHNNPVKRRLVKSPDQWRWSSFRWLELGRRENEPLELDEWDDGSSTSRVEVAR